MMETRKSPVSWREGWAAGFYEEKWRLMALFFIPRRLLNSLCGTIFTLSFIASACLLLSGFHLVLFPFSVTISSFHFISFF